MNNEVSFSHLMRQELSRLHRSGSNTSTIIYEITNVDEEVENANRKAKEKQNSTASEGSSLRWQDLSFTEGLGDRDGLLCEPQCRLQKVLKERRI